MLASRKYLILLTVFILIFYHVGNTQSRHSFSIANGQFVYDGKPIQIHSGEMHYARIPREYWQHRLRMLKAMGMNTVATYVFWNHHNIAPGVWDFTTGNRNLSAFLQLAKQEGLLVILRPGPYACAEWEFGGYPWWLQNDTTLVVRTYNKAFLDSCKVYINKLADQVKPLLITNGGPVIMVQSENEFGSYVAQRKDIPIEQHKKYNLAIRQTLVDAGINVPLFTSDGSWLFEGGSISGILPTANGEDDIENLKKTVNKYHNNEGPYMVAEYYPGWLDHWAEPFPKVPDSAVVKDLEKYLKNGVSFNIYMAHGGTNFGFSSGANYDKQHGIQPDMTSYDYDAPISEAGWATSKYTAIRELMKKYVQYPIPDIPADIPVIKNITPIHLNKSVDVLSLIKKAKAIVSDTILSMEDCKQGNGYILYSRHFTQPAEGKLSISGLRDYAVVYVNGVKKGVLNRVNNTYTMDIEVPFNGTLDILVENMGRINYGSAIIYNKKGIISPVLINGQSITGSWKIYQLPLATMPDWKEGELVATVNRPAFYKGSFTLNNLGDVFLDMRTWGKGIVFVNGYNLGRYWSVGPQQTLYLPASFLAKGKNEVVIFEQLNENLHSQLSFLEKPILSDLK